MLFAKNNFCERPLIISGCYKHILTLISKQAILLRPQKSVLKEVAMFIQVIHRVTHLPHTLPIKSQTLT